VKFLLLLAAVAAVAWIWISAGREAAAPALPPPPAGAAQVPEPPAAPLAVRDVAGPLAAVLADLRAADAAGAEAWIAGGYSSDLADLVQVTGLADGYGPLNVSARRFSSDAAGYLDANGGPGGLEPGWRAGYAQLRADLNALAADTGQRPVPAPPRAPDATAPQAPLPPQSAGFYAPPATAQQACTAKTTVTASSSSTGAHSRSVRTATACGTGRTSVTRRTSVSRTGKITSTVTTTAG
jgi:hypothetical protein